MGYAPGAPPAPSPVLAALWSELVLARSSWRTSRSRRGRRPPSSPWACGPSPAWSTRLTIARELRPVDEPFPDVAAVVLALAIGAGVGVTVRLAGTRAGVPAPDVAAAFAAVAVHGTGLAGGGLVAAVVARPPLRHGHPHSGGRRVDHRRPAPRPRRPGAARQGRVDGLGLHRPPGRRSRPRRGRPRGAPGWVEHPLLVGGDRVGTLLLDADRPGGTRAASGPHGRAAAAHRRARVPGGGARRGREHARQDVARERDAERARILRDLHDGLGPVLAGMSMRVQAELRRSPTPLLESLAPELAEARGDLRRLVSGLTPSALHDDDLDGALERLVATFDGDGRQVGLEVDVEQPMPSDVTVAVYRSVAEGITNALRHGAASPSPSGWSTAGGRVVVDVGDDGVGGPIAPGVGLTSLRQRAEQLGGSLAVGPRDGGGTLLHVELPTGASRMTRVMLVDDHPIVLSGLSALVESDDGLDLVAVARTAAEARDVTTEPDVAVVDLGLPDGDGIELGAALKRTWPALRVIVLTMTRRRPGGHPQPGSRPRRLPPQGLRPRGRPGGHPHRCTRLPRARPGAAGRGRRRCGSAPRTDALAALDTRDLEILDLLVEGLPTSQVAARLFLAPKTVRNRVSDMLTKLRVARARKRSRSVGQAASGGPERADPACGRTPVARARRADTASRRIAQLPAAFAAGVGGHGHTHRHLRHEVAEHRWRCHGPRTGSPYRAVCSGPRFDCTGTIPYDEPQLTNAQVNGVRRRHVGRHVGAAVAG